MENEILVRQALRIYRNAAISFVRAKLIDRFGAEAGSQLERVFAKRDPTSGRTQWEDMRLKAERARAAPEISTSVDDDFELIGVGDLYPVFETFFDALFPQYEREDAQLKQERRAGILRCIRQIKVFRDPSAHEVTEDLNRDSVMLLLANILAVLKACPAENETQQVRNLLNDVATSKPSHEALFVSVSEEGAQIATTLMRTLKARTVTCDHLRLKDLPIGPTERASLEKKQNIIPVVCGDDKKLPILEEASQHGLKHGKRILPLIAAMTITPEKIKSSFGQAASLSVAFHQQYIQEAAGRVLSKLVPSIIYPASKPSIPYVPVAEALADEKLRNRLVSSLRTPGWKCIWLVSPFASDVAEWTLTRQALSVILAELRQEGVAVTLITRPPSESEGIEEKTQFLDRLERDNVEVLLNECLHAKIYLFENAAPHFRWYLGSHNLTVSGLTRWRDVSLAGFREVEYAEVKTAMHRIQRHKDTIPYHIWKAKEARSPRGIQ